MKKKEWTTREVSSNLTPNEVERLAAAAAQDIDLFDENPTVTLKLDTYSLVSDAVELGCGFGVNRAFKHTGSPTREAIIDAVHREVMNYLSNIIKWD